MYPLLEFDITELFSHLAYISLGLSAVQDSLANTPDSKKAKLSPSASTFFFLLSFFSYSPVPLQFPITLIVLLPNVSYLRLIYFLLKVVQLLWTPFVTIPWSSNRQLVSSCLPLTSLSNSANSCLLVTRLSTSFSTPKKSVPLVCSSAISKLLPLPVLYASFCLSSLLSHKFSFLQITTNDLESGLPASPKKTNNVAEAINVALA